MNIKHIKRLCLVLIFIVGHVHGVRTSDHVTAAFGLYGKINHNFYAVQEGALYRSAQLTPEVLAVYLQALGIKTVINLRGEQPENEWWLEEQEVCRLLGVQLYNIPMSCHFLPSRTNLIELLDIFDHAPRPILIHCIAGADRTGEAAALWVRAMQGKGKQEALKQQSIKYHHVWFVHPAKRFFQELWRGRDWLKDEYEPKHYSWYAIVK